MHVYVFLLTPLISIKFCNVKIQASHVLGQVSKSSFRFFELSLKLLPARGNAHSQIKSI